MSYIKNIAPEKILTLSGEITAAEGQIVSKTLAQNAAVTMTLFAFAKGEEISTHISEGDALVTVLEGTGRFTVEGKDYLLSQEESLLMPALKPHAVYASEAFKMLLVVILPPVSAK